MQLKQKSRYTSCPHKRNKKGSVSQKFLEKISLFQNSLSKATLSKNSKKNVSNQQAKIKQENQRLRRENTILQQYFGVFQQRLLEQKNENDLLRKQLRKMRKSVEGRLLTSRKNPQIQSLQSMQLSESDLMQNESRITKSTRYKSRHTTDYL